MRPTLVRALAAAVVLVPVTRAASASAQHRPAGIPAIDSIATAELRATQMPGAVVAVVHRGQLVHLRGYGLANAQTRAPMTADLAFQIGSVTKMLTAALVVTLAREGVLDLGAPVGRYVAGLSPRVGRIPLHHLVGQTGGLRDIAGGEGAHDEGALLAFARTLGDSVAPLDPGDAFSYSNVGYALAGLAAQEATGRPFADLLRERVFAPLGMRATLRASEAAAWPAAAGHAGGRGEPATALTALTSPEVDTRVWPAGYVHARAEDVARFVLALLERGRLDGRPALPPGVTDSLLRPRVVVRGMPNDTRYGLGVFVDRLRGRESAWHAGTQTSSSALVRTIPAERIGVVVFGNRAGVRLDHLAEEALAASLRAAGVRFDREESRATVGAPLVKTTVRLTGDELRRMEGRYANRWPMELRVRRDTLLLTRFGAELPVTPLGEGLFSVQPSGAPRPDVFGITPATASRPAFIEMYLWAFPRAAP